MNDRDETQSRRLKLITKPIQVDSAIIRAHLYRLALSLERPGWERRLPTVQINDDDLPELLGCVRWLPERLKFPREHMFWAGTESELDNLTNQILRGLDQSSVIVLYAAEFLNPHELQLLQDDDFRSRARVILVMEAHPETTASARRWPKTIIDQLDSQPWPKLSQRLGDWKTLFREGIRRATEKKRTLEPNIPTPDVSKQAQKLLLETDWRPLDGAMNLVQFGEECGALALQKGGKPPIVTGDIIREVRHEHSLCSNPSIAQKRPTYPPPPMARSSSAERA